MPEGDSVYQLARRLQPLTGARVLRSDFRVPSYATVDLSGTTIEAIWPYGKHLFIQCDSRILHTHLRMDGVWHVHWLGERWNKPGYTARVILVVHCRGAEAPTELVGHNLGLVEVFRVDEYSDRIAYLGPDVLNPDWDEGGREEAARRILRQRDTAIGVALLDQRAVAGIGNEYRAEACFLAGIHPDTPVADLGERGVFGVLDLVHRLMISNRDAPLRVTTGVRRAGESTWVFGRHYRPCRRCGTQIEQGWLGPETGSGDGGQERVIWWCPHCQPRPGRKTLGSSRFA